MMNRLPSWAVRGVRSLIGDAEGERATDYLDELMLERPRSWAWVLLQVTGIVVAHTIGTVWEAGRSIVRRARPLDWSTAKRFARVNARRPGYAVSLAGVITIGIGGSVAALSIGESVLDKPLPHPDPGRLVAIVGHATRSSPEPTQLTPIDVADIRALPVFQDVAGIGYTDEPTLNHQGSAERVSVALVTTNLFDLLGTRASLGRVFNEADGSRARDPDDPVRPVLLSHQMWTRSFAGDTSVVGTLVTLNGENSLIVGVLPQEFRLSYPSTQAVGLVGPPPELIDAFWPLLLPDPDAGGQRGVSNAWLRPVGRLAPGRTIDESQAALTALAQNWNGEHDAHADEGTELSIESLHESLVGDARVTLRPLSVAAQLLFLLTCAAASSLVLLQVMRQSRDDAIRSALGASKIHVAASHFAGHAVIVLAGSALGLLLASWAIASIQIASPPTLPRVTELGLSAGWSLQACLIALIVPIGFGAIPILRKTRAAHAALTTARSFGGRGASRTRSALVSVQLGMTVAIACGISLLFQTTLNLNSVDPGFAPESVLTFEAAIPWSIYWGQPAASAAFYDDVLSTVRDIPGVTAVASASYLPFQGASRTQQYGRTQTELRDAPQVAEFREVTPDFFETMEIPLLGGRTFVRGDSNTTLGSRNVVVNESLASQMFEEPRRALGATVWIPSGSDVVPAVIVGIVGDVYHRALNEDPTGAMYIHQPHPPPSWIVVRHVGDPSGIAPSIREAVAEIDRTVPVEIEALEQRVDESWKATRMALWLFVAFGVWAGAASFVGLLSVTEAAVDAKRREIGVRIALGARASDVLKNVNAESAKSLSAGLGIGVFLTIFVAGAISDSLFGVSPYQPNLLAFAALSSLGMMTLALAPPTLRALGLAPSEVLRGD